MRTSLRPIAFVTSLAIAFTCGVGQAAASPDREGGVQQIAPGPLPQETFGALVDVYAAVESMPAHFEAMSDEDGAAQWLHADFESRGWLSGCPECAATAVRADVEKCLIGTADFIISNLTPARWILMLWKVIKQHGSSLTVVGALNEALTRSHLEQRDTLQTVLEVFGAVGSTISNVLSLDGIFKNCFYESNQEVAEGRTRALVIGHDHSTPAPAATCPTIRSRGRREMSGWRDLTVICLLIFGRAGKDDQQGEPRRRAP